MKLKHFLFAEEGGNGGTGGTGGEGNAGGTGDTGGTSAPWHGQTEADAVAYITNKGWQSPADVIKSYQGAEKLIGRDPNTLLSMPRADDAAGFRAVMSKLGMPEDASKYELDVPKGVTPNEAFTGWAKDTFHEVGLTAAQAKLLSAKHNDYVAGMQSKMEADYKLALEADKQALMAEWRDGHERMMNSAEASARALGFTGPMIDAMEKAIGYKETMKHFAALGKRMSEDGFVSEGSGKNNFNTGLTPEEAKAQWNTMKTDPIEGKALFDAMHPGHKAAKEKQARLFKIMYPE